MNTRRKNYRKPVSGQALLLSLIWRKKGGPKRVSQVLGIKWFMPGNWARDGRVPMEHVQKVAGKLKVPHWGLNYRQVVQAYGSEAPSWKEAVKLYKLAKAEEKEVLDLGEP